MRSFLKFSRRCSGFCDHEQLDNFTFLFCRGRTKIYNERAKLLFRDAVPNATVVA